MPRKKRAETKAGQGTQLQTHTVRWYQQFEITGIQAESDEQAIEIAQEKIGTEEDEGESIDSFDFQAEEEQ